MPRTLRHSSTACAAASLSRAQGYNFTRSLKARMEFQNPYLEAVVQQLGIDDAGKQPVHMRARALPGCC